MLLQQLHRRPIDRNDGVGGGCPVIQRMRSPCVHEALPILRHLDVWLSHQGTDSWIHRPCSCLVILDHLKRWHGLGSDWIPSEYHPLQANRQYQVNHPVPVCKIESYYGFAEHGIPPKRLVVTGCLTLNPQTISLVTPRDLAECPLYAGDSHGDDIGLMCVLHRRKPPVGLAGNFVHVAAERATVHFEVKCTYSRPGMPDHVLFCIIRSFQSNLGNRSCDGLIFIPIRLGEPPGVNLFNYVDKQKDAQG